MLFSFKRDTFHRIEKCLLLEIHHKVKTEKTNPLKSQLGQVSLMSIHLFKPVLPTVCAFRLFFWLWGFLFVSWVLVFFFLLSFKTKHFKFRF